MASKANDTTRSNEQLLDVLRLDPQDSTPLYLQVRNAIARAIKLGVVKPEEALPSERVLSEALGISRVTARKAIDTLSEEGLIIRRRGSGNYIAPMLEQRLLKLTSFTEEIRQRGFTPSSHWLRRAIVDALPAETLALGLSPNSKVAKLERVRLADDVPMAYEVSALPETLLPNPDAVKDSLYDYLSGHSLLPVRALQHIRATNATPKQAELLTIPVGQALLYITRVAYLEDGRVIEITHTYCRSDYYDFISELSR